MRTLIISSLDNNAVSKAASIIRRGGIVVYPTETSYGIGADWTNPRAVRNIFKVKGRDEMKKISVIVPSLAVIKKYATMSNDAIKLTKAFMPGPLTLVVPLKAGGTVAFRISSHRFANALSKISGTPITATSANRAGGPPVYDAREAAALFVGKADAIVDAGKLRKRKASTIYDVWNRAILREGQVSERDIAKTVGRR